MDLLAFDISGRMAHFRKIYSTSSSLSYFFPPRTTIAGLVAGILGFERDSYYENFSAEKCKISVSICSPLRKLILPVNYLDTDTISESKFRGRGRRVPTSVEILLPELPYERVKYRIFIWHEYLMNQLEERLTQRKFSYPPSLGSAHYLAEVSAPLRVSAHKFVPSGSINLSTTIPISKVASVPTNIRICSEARVPVVFSAERKLVQIEDYLCQTGGEPINGIRVNGEVFSCEGLPHGTYGIFME